jgi:hypothetical protein
VVYFFLSKVFFQLERESLLQSQEDGLNNGAYTVKRILAQERQVESPDKVALRPPQYRHLVLPSDWYVVGSKYTGKGDPNSYRRDRKHRKTHGVISFVELTKLVSSKWKVVDPETKEYCRNIAQGEFNRYRKELEEFIKTYGADAAKGKKRKPRKSKTKQAVEPKMQPDKPQQIPEPEPFGGDYAFIPVDDEDIISVDLVHTSKEKVDVLSKVNETNFENSVGEGMSADFSFYAPNRVRRHGDMCLVDKSISQDQAQSEMYPITPCSRTPQGNQRVSLQDVESRSLRLPYNFTNRYGDNLDMMTSPVSDVSTFQGRAVDRSFSMPVGYGNDHSYVHGNNLSHQGFPQALDPYHRSREFGINQGLVSGSDLDQFVRQYEQDISRDMTQKRSLELQRQLHAQQQRQQQRQNCEIQNCVEQLYLLQFHKKCVINGRRDSMGSTRRSSMDMGGRISMDRSRRSSMDDAFGRSRSSSSSMNVSFRRSSLPPRPKIFQASTVFPQLTVQQELIIKNLAEQEKRRKTSLQTLSNPTTNCPSAA